MLRRILVALGWFFGSSFISAAMLYFADLDVWTGVVLAFAAAAVLFVGVALALWTLMKPRRA